MKQYRSARDVVAAVERAIADDQPVSPQNDTLQEITRILAEGRHYFWVGVYLTVGNQAVRAAFTGPEAEKEPCAKIALGSGNVGLTAQDGKSRYVPDASADSAYIRAFPETQSEVTAPIKIAGRTIGVLNAESEHVNGFSSEDRVLLKDVASELALFLTADGKYIVRRFREASAQPLEKHQPSSERSIEQSRKVAAGEKLR